MTLEEEYEEYKKVFILVMEVAGDNTDNDIYRNVEKYVNHHKYNNLMNSLLSNNISLDIFIGLLILILLIESCSIVGLMNLGLKKCSSMMLYIFDNYLKDPTRKFTSTHGLPIIDKLDVDLIIKKLNENLQQY